MEHLQRRSVTCIFGAGESGKTSFAIRYLLNARGVGCRFIFDPDGEFAARLKLKPHSTALEIEIGIRQGWVLFDPAELFGGDTEAALAFFCDLAMQFSAGLPGRKLFVVDEVWRHCSVRSIPPELLAVVKTGRKVSLQSVFITQEPRELNETLLAEGTEFVSFRLQGLNSLGRLADYGMPGQEQLPTLPRGQFIAWNKLSGGVTRAKLF
jgi:hypothetical protein